MYTVPAAAHGGAQHPRQFGPQRAPGVVPCAIGPYGEHSSVAICRYAALGHLSVLGSGWQYRYGVATLLLAFPALPAQLLVRLRVLVFRQLVSWALPVLL